MIVKASACAKTILFGEHAVVYDEPAIAIPLKKIRTHAQIESDCSLFRIISPNISLDSVYADLIPGSGLQVLLEKLMTCFSLDTLPNAALRISSDIPIASGLGSGAALSVAVIRAFSGFLVKNLSNETINEIAYEVEKVYHGTPSGIDNTTIAYEQAIIFSRSSGFVPLNADTGKLDMLVIDSGISSRTIEVVSDVRANFPQNEVFLREIGALVRSAVKVLESGDTAEIGHLMNENQELLRCINVSSPELNELIDLGLSHGALGGKLTGAGRGGNILILAKDPEQAAYLKELYENHGSRVIL